MNIEFDATFFAFVAFLLFFALVIYLKAPAMVLSALDARSAEIAKELAEARRLRQEAELLLADYTAKRKAAEDEAVAMLANAREQATSLAADARANAAEALTRRTQQAESRIAQAEVQAAQDVRAAATDAAIAAAERALRANVNERTQSELVSAGVAEMRQRFR